MIGMPLVGWALVSLSPLHIPTMLYGLVELPNLPVLPALENKHEIHEVLDNAHMIGAYLLAGLFVLHTGAAFKHHWFDRDGVLLSMAPTPFVKLLLCLRGQKSQGRS
jgi:cytochrome b561